MIRVVIKGGLGNQMFQYVYGKVLARKYSHPLQLDISFYDKESAYRHYTLNKLGIEENLISEKPKKIKISLWKRLLPLNLFLLRLGLKPLTTVYLDGYWQSENYFDRQDSFVRSLFKFPDPPASLKEQVLGTDSVAVHVRRGDYVNIPRRHICHLDYFLRGMKKIQRAVPAAKFFIFSDDIAWCQDTILTEFPDAVLVKGCNSDFEELHLMSLCKHIVISNSSFSWWGAWLQEKPGKQVISPDRWVDEEKLNYEFMVKDKIIPERWQLIAVSNSH